MFDEKIIKTGDYVTNGKDVVKVIAIEANFNPTTGNPYRTQNAFLGYIKGHGCTNHGIQDAVVLSKQYFYLCPNNKQLKQKEEIPKCFVYGAKIINKDNGNRGTLIFVKTNYSIKNGKIYGMPEEGCIVSYNIYRQHTLHGVSGGYWEYIKNIKLDEEYELLNESER